MRAGPRDILDRLRGVLGQAPDRLEPLSGGCIAEVYRVRLADGASVVAKVASGAGTLDIEGYMLGALRSRTGLPVPTVLHGSADLLVMEFIEGESRFDAPAQEHAAELLAQLHGIRQPEFGLERDTLIGSLHQPNTGGSSWIEFFRERRLVFMADRAEGAGRLPLPVRRRIDMLAARLGELIDEPAHPSLVHGDIWTTNVLASRGRITAFLDPAIYCGHPEVELAFITLFSTFGAPFFRRYAQLRPIPPGFFQTRAPLYNLYPLLVHTTLFGSGYAAQVDSTLGSLGF